MKIEFHNDAKEKHQSWTASAVFSMSREEGHFSFDITAYGATQSEAHINFCVIKTELTDAVGEFWEVV